MNKQTWRAAVCGLAGALAVSVIAAAQTPPPLTTVFRVFLADREAGRETDILTTSPGGRMVESTLSFTTRGATRQLDTRIQAGFDWAVRQLISKGQPFPDGAIDANLTAPANPAAFAVAGPLPVVVQEYLINYWRSHGRPREIASVAGDPVRIRARAEEQVQIGARVVRLERLSVEGPAWGSQTAWADFNANLVALTTWAGGLPLTAIREGFESRLDRFETQAIRDRMEDLEQLTNLVMADHSAGVVLTGATVLTIPTRPPILDATVVIRDGKIVAVGASSRVQAPADLPAVDMRGLTILAGLWDMGSWMSQVELGPAYLAAGITSVRTISPDGEFATVMRDMLAASPTGLLGPRMFQAGLIEGPDGLGSVRAGTPDEARQAVRQYRSDGLRQIEAGESLTAPVLAVIASEARRLGMRVGGRLPAGVPLAQAIDARLDQLTGAFAGGDGDGSLAALARAQTALAPQAAWSEVLLRAPGTPGQILLHADGVSPPRSLVARLESVAMNGATGDRAALIASLRRAREAGVALVPATGRGIPGSTLVRELELFVEAGMTPADALQAATVVPARLMKADDSGAVEPGKRADLIIVAGNPLESIGNLRRTRWVVANGKLYDCAKLWKAVGWTTGN